MNKLINGYSYIEVPSGTGKKLSEGEWRGIVDCETDSGINFFEDYERKQELWYTATESGLSLLKSLNLLDKYERGELLILKEKK